MEQQTISISKAGITATLNARTSILAAANPIGGRYDRSRSLKDNISITPPLMSRFDLFFVILDECDSNTDHKIASHIINMHRHQYCLFAFLPNRESASNAFFTTQQLQHYIAFAREFSPGTLVLCLSNVVITPESEEILVNCYRELRQNDATGSTAHSYRITVRQLESLIRLSEAIARLQMDDEVRPSYVREAQRLLKTSIIHVETGDVDLKEMDSWEVEEGMEVEEAEAEEPPPAQPLHVTYEEYKRIANAMVILIRQTKEKQRKEYPEKQVMGITMGRLVSELLQTMHIEDPEELAYKKMIVKKIIRRLINKDHVLVVNCDIANLDESDWILDIHPNYVLA